MHKGATLVLALLAALGPAAVQAAVKADTGLVGYNALNLTSAQERSVYQAVGAVPEVAPPEHYLIHVGGEVPAAMSLKQLPHAASVQAPQVANDNYVKLDQGQLLLVNPKDRAIVEIIDSYHGTAEG
jgi:hypothetical protein